MGIDRRALSKGLTIDLTDEKNNSTARKKALGKGDLYGNVIRTGLLLNSTTDTIDQVIVAVERAWRFVRKFFCEGKLWY